MARGSSSSVRATKWWSFELACLALAAATAVLGVSAAVPFAADLAHCPKSCGGVNISYPYGVGPGCFRPGFEVTCNRSTRPPKLFLGSNDTTTEIVQQYPWGIVQASIVFNIAIRPDGAPGTTYNISWEALGRNLYAEYSNMVMVGCGIEAYMFAATDPGNMLGFCESTCSDMAAMENWAEGRPCSGMGCCSIRFKTSFRLSIIQKEEALPTAVANATVKAFATDHVYFFSTADLLSDTVNESTIGASTVYLRPVITDQPNCRKAKKDKQYACAASSCWDDDDGRSGYTCFCTSQHDDGNPYIVGPGGCSQGYEPSHDKLNCSRTCGNTSIPFPFGLEPECSATAKFQLNCTSSQLLTQRSYVQYQVVNISVEEGLLSVNRTYDPKHFLDNSDLIMEDTDFSELYGIWKWAISNTTCDLAKNQNHTSYACISANSECTNVTDGHVYIGYRCKCSQGYEGNPYIRNGCNDINECLMIPYLCTETCYNREGSYNCTSCPQGTWFDPVQRQCTSSKHRSLVFVVAIGLGSGFGVLALTLSTTILIQQWKRHARKTIRRAYFRRNKGLLLEQLIVSSEKSATQSTKIFSLDDLEMATNDFDSTRIVGCGGHGTVYKGILSDQRVVAIKKSKIVEQSEIDQFINEVAILSQIIHRNVVKLFGCCLESEVPLLVYEFISNGTLYDLLHGDLSARCLLTWDDRTRVALEAANALAYLHSAASIPIFHRDVKSANILLNDSFTAKVSDFGASRSISIDETHVVTIVQGTFGYLDPEYYHTGQLNEKSDVYSFGVILVELLTRKKPIFLNCFGEKQNLSHCFLQTLPDKTTAQMLDPQVFEEADEREIDEMASLAEMCLKLRGEERPTMREVELRLQLLRGKVTKKNQQDLHVDKETEPLLLSEANANSCTQHIELGKISSPTTRESTRCYTMEKELVSWSDLPR
ncbi:unnamed protein product [Urochloa decumbens]|uniref:Protein kinase domain-containing protein n=1 Tax=Urochloa decumbens TaxID=240449 RepID=A0ABC9AAS3_9POAL